MTDAGQAGMVPGALVIEAGLLLSPQACSLVARGLQQLVRQTERLDGGQLPRGMLVVLAQLQRAARLASSDADARTQVPADADPAASGHGDLLTAAAAAGLLGCTAANVRDLARRGALDGRRVGGRWLFDRLEVIGLVEARRRSAVA